jgi:ferredoxin-NADP reductase
MARAAVSRRLIWRVARLVEARPETPTARTLVLDVPDWPGHLPGQHVDVRLTAPDGYTAERSYSIASAPAADGRLELTIQRVPDGEVSPYLGEVFAIGDAVEIRGPVGGWFVWRNQPPPVLLVAGGSGVVPLMAMIRARAGTSRAPFRLVYSVRTPADRIYASELRRRVAEDGGLDVAWVHTRIAPDGDPRPPGRLRAEDLAAHGWPPDFEPTCYVCGPTGFVEAAATLLTNAGHEPARIRTERFGGA